MFVNTKFCWDLRMFNLRKFLNIRSFVNIVLLIFMPRPSFMSCPLFCLSRSCQTTGPFSSRKTSSSSGSTRPKREASKNSETNWSGSRCSNPSRPRRSCRALSSLPIPGLESRILGSRIPELSRLRVWTGSRWFADSWSGARVSTETVWRVTHRWLRGPIKSGVRVRVKGLMRYPNLLTSSSTMN